MTSMSIEAINRRLFEILNADVGLSELPLALATLSSEGALAILLIWNWLSATSREQGALAQLVVAVPLALAMNYLIGVAYPHPRPFMIGLGHTFVSHRIESSFPSDYATAMWTMAFGMLCWSRAKWAGCFAAGLAALTSWARVFLGMHFPFDILGSVAVAAVVITALITLRTVVGRRIACPIDPAVLNVTVGDTSIASEDRSTRSG